MVFVNGTDAQNHGPACAEAEQRAHPWREAPPFLSKAKPPVERDGAVVFLDNLQPDRREAGGAGVTGDRAQKGGSDAAPAQRRRNRDAVKKHLARSWGPLKQDHKGRAPKRAQSAKAAPEIGGFASNEPSGFIVKTGEANQGAGLVESADGVLRAHDRNKKRLRPVASPYDRAKLLGEGVEVKPRGGGAKMFRQADLEGRARRSGHQAAAILARIASVISVVPTLFPPVTVIRSGVR